MSRPIRSLAVLLCGSLLLGAAPATKPAAKLDPYDVFGSMRRLQRSRDPVARAFTREVREGTRALALQRAAARREGIPLTVADLRLTATAQNAAVLYLRLSNLLKEKPPDRLPHEMSRSLTSRFAFSDAELASVRQMMADRSDVMDLLHQATDAPRCVLPRNYSDQLWNHLGTGSYHPIMREAVRLVWAESYLLAREGRYTEAIANQTRGFRLAGHAAADPFVISQLVGGAIEATTLAGMGEILCLAGADAEIADRVQQTIRDSGNRYSLRHVLRGEVVGHLQTLRVLRRGGPKEIPQWALSDAEQAAARRTVRPRRLTAAHWKKWHLLFDAAEARYLRLARSVMAEAGKPSADCRVLFRKAVASIEARERIPIGFFLRFTDIDFEMAIAERHRQMQVAGTNVVLAGARVLAYQARRGELPKDLSEVTPEPILDPFSGGSIRYRREADGFVVYSVGLGGKFSPGPPESGRAPGGILFRYPAPPPEPHPDFAAMIAPRRER